MLHNFFIRTFFPFLLLIFWGLNCQANTIYGIVVAVADGDTITVLDTNKQQHKIRLLGIDAPEKNQNFGDRSKRSMSDLVYKKQVVVDVIKKDRYARSLGKVMINGKDANLEQVKLGLAWHYKHYQRDQSPTDRLLYSEAEKFSKNQKLGLWQDKNPLPPWEFRRTKK